MAQKAKFEATPTKYVGGLIQPEGPIILGDGTVILVEMGRGTLSRIDTEGNLSVVAEVGGGPNGAAIGPDGACYVVNNGGVSAEKVGPFRLPAEGYEWGWVDRVDLKNGRISRLYEGSADVPLTGLNDIVFDEWGGFWFTDCGKYHQQHLTHGGIYWASYDGGNLKQVVYPVLAPNGIALSPDGRTLYVALMEHRQLVAFTITGPGELRKAQGGQPQAEVLCSLPGNLKLDSMSVEECGNIVVAAMSGEGPGQLIVVSPEGDVVETVQAGTTMANNLAFGGSDMRQCYVALLRDGEVATLLWPRPGLRPLFT
ncbi:SMP-30/gluconolactonase/LRE family protein [Paenarthrobacter sp. NPDC057981]|uniref:SMP-30/gluconolactonase/LRE family protein n=1 Tax=Paenarthrobacter sp. NPDC057981 TaxID=3346297 RepID=UPI0036DB93C6